MEEIGMKYKNDKVLHHKYHEIYPRYIEKFYDSDGSMLEVGVCRGGNPSTSLSMWLELFPNMHIYGMEKEGPHETHEDIDRATIIKGDQSLENDLKEMIDRINHPLYFINDDGSHIPEHQLLTFNLLFPKLEVGGVYIIEDIETSYWLGGECYGYPVKYGVGHEDSIVEIFKSALDGVNYEFSKTREGLVEHQERIHSICFARNCIIITKKQPNDRRYRFGRKLKK